MSIKLKWLIAILLILSLTGGVYAQSFQRFPVDWLIAKRITNNGISTLAGNVTAGGNVAVTGAVTAADVTTSDDVTVGDFLAINPQTSITVTASGRITPTGSSLLLASSGAVGTRLIVTTTMGDGSVLFVQNVGAQTITLTDTAPLVLSGNAVLGANDTVLLRLRNGSWVQFSKTDN